MSTLRSKQSSLQTKQTGRKKVKYKKSVQILSVHERTKHLSGVVSAQPDLSRNKKHLLGFGE